MCKKDPKAEDKRKIATEKGGSLIKSNTRARRGIESIVEDQLLST